MPVIDTILTTTTDLTGADPNVLITRDGGFFSDNPSNSGIEVASALDLFSYIVVHGTIISEAAAISL